MTFLYVNINELGVSTECVPNTSIVCFTVIKIFFLCHKLKEKSNTEYLKQAKHIYLLGLFLLLLYDHRVLYRCRMILKRVYPVCKADLEFDGWAHRTLRIYISCVKKCHFMSIRKEEFLNKVRFSMVSIQFASACLCGSLINIRTEYLIMMYWSIIE